MAKAPSKYPRIVFCSYEGSYPNLCAGTLTMEIDGVMRTDFRLHSGGCCYFTDDDGVIESGPWTVTVPDDLKPYEKTITDLVNLCVPWGCCGGCL